jgi:hypothetical protein
MPKFLVTDESNKLIAVGPDGPTLLKSFSAGWEGRDLLKAEDKPEPVDKADARTPHFGAHHAELAASTEEGDDAHETAQECAGHMRAGDAEGLRASLRKAEPDARDHCLDHVHPDHWEKLGFRAIDKDGADAAFTKKFSPEQAKEPAGDAKGGEAPAKPAKAADEAKGEDMTKALIFTNDPTALAALMR